MNEPLKRGTVLHSTLADCETVDELFRLILGRSINNNEFKANVHNAATAHHWVMWFGASPRRSSTYAMTLTS
jgi:hypothetical protein